MDGDEISYLWIRKYIGISVNHTFQAVTKRVVGNGAKTLFWEDKWLGDKSLAESFPSLYSIAVTKNVTVQFLMRSGLDMIVFRRILYGEALEQWENLRYLVPEHEFSECQDKVTWSLNGRNKFVVRELYLWLKDGRLVGFRSIWKLKIPNKIKVFLWLMLKNILTKDNLVIRGWTRNEECQFCGAKGSIDHLFFECAVAKLTSHVVSRAFGRPSIPANLFDLMGNSIWKTRNRACFDLKKILMILLCWCIGFAFILMLGVRCRKPR